MEPDSSQRWAVKGQAATVTSCSNGTYLRLSVVNCSQGGWVCGGEGQEQAVGLQDL